MKTEIRKIINKYWPHVKVGHIEILERFRSDGSNSMRCYIDGVTFYLGTLPLLMIKEIHPLINRKTEKLLLMPDVDSDSEPMSACCDAPIIMTDICSKCREHCDKQEDV